MNRVDLRQLRKLIRTWAPLVGTEPRDTGDPLAQLGLLITSTLRRTELFKK